MRNDFTCQR